MSVDDGLHFWHRLLPTHSLKMNGNSSSHFFVEHFSLKVFNFWLYCLLRNLRDYSICDEVTKELYITLKIVKTYRIVDLCSTSKWNVSLYSCWCVFNDFIILIMVIFLNSLHEFITEKKIVYTQEIDMYIYLKNYHD